MEMTEILGPQNPGDGALLRRLRLHQSWYRADVLRLSRWGATYGQTPKALGSILREQDATVGLNFISPAAFQLFKERRAKGWGIDPRCTAYMTSSQALTINLIGLLGRENSWFTYCLNTWLGRTDLSYVLRTELEFAPTQRSLHLNDQTRIDVLIEVEGRNGLETVAIEVKYADRFNSRRVDINTPRYHSLGRRSGLWRDPTRVLIDFRLNQLARVHALATSYARSTGIIRPASLIAVVHESDATAHKIVNSYATCVSESVVALVPLRLLCATVLEAAPAGYQTLAERLYTRYGCEMESEALERRLTQTGPAVSQLVDRSGGRVA